MPKLAKNKQFLYLVSGGVLKANHVVVGQTSESELNSLKNTVACYYGSEATLRTLRTSEPEKNLKTVLKKHQKVSLSPDDSVLNLSIKEAIESLKLITEAKVASKVSLEGAVSVNKNSTQQAKEDVADEEENEEKNSDEETNQESEADSDQDSDQDSDEESNQDSESEQDSEEVEEAKPVKKVSKKLTKKTVVKKETPKKNTKKVKVAKK